MPKRARILFKFHQLLVDNWEELAKINYDGKRKNYTEAYGEVQRGIESVEFAAGAPTLMMGSQLPTHCNRSGIRRVPLSDWRHWRNYSI